MYNTRHESTKSELLGGVCGCYIHVCLHICKIYNMMHTSFFLEFRILLFSRNPVIICIKFSGKPFHTLTYMACEASESSGQNRQG